MLFKLGADSQEFFICLGHFLGELGNLMRSANTSYYVLALGVYEIFAIESVFAICRVSCKGDSRRAGVALVAEHHRLNIYSRSPF